MLGSECDLKIHVPNLGYTLPLQIGGPKPPFFFDFATQPQLLMAYTFGMKHDIHIIGQVRWKLRGSPTSSQNFMNFGPQSRLKLDLHFYPPCVSFAFYFIVRLPIHRSANRTQPNFAKRLTVNGANNVM